MSSINNQIVYGLISCFVIVVCFSQSLDKDLDNADALKPSFWLFNRDTTQHGKDLGMYPNFYWNIDMIGVNQRDTKILVHGWSTDRFSRFSIQLKDAYLEVMDVNVILIDWSGLAVQPYSDVIENLNSTAQHVTEFINYLVKYQHLDVNRVHFIGYGLGAHLAGLACKNLKQKVSAITALDPISLICKSQPSGRLSPHDAQYVEVIHTGSRRFLGPLITMGHADFFPNGGKLQPGCGLDLLATCSGERSVDLFISSIKADKPVFIGVRCNRILEAVQQRCSSIVKGRMGGKNVTRKYGIYALTTTDKSPFY